MRASLLIKGILQGVGFRPFVYRKAIEKNLVGFVQNRGDSGVKIVVEGNKSNISNFIKCLKLEKPPIASIHEIMVKYSKQNDEFKKFSIVQSDQKGNTFGSIIPYDISICNECFNELQDSENRRCGYFFITCTNCGPRYTAIKKVPYDRINTTMQEFPMCKDCKKEYTNPLNRRFHAQTIACNKCGPSVELIDSEGNKIEHSDPIREAGRLIEEGYIVAIKGNGGFHISTSTLIDSPLERIRKVKHRTQKPFAIMAPNIDAIKTFAKISNKEADYLSSPIRPIVLLKKSDEYYLSRLISPKLHNIGVMLPYIGLHHILFEKISEPAFVMTSANPPNEPIIMDNELAINELGSIVDYFLTHDREITQRCDDSVVKFVGENISIIRRSRGYAPTPIHVKMETERCILGVGAEQNVTCCILKDKKAFISQHIGDIETPETLDFLKNVIEHLIRLTRSKIDLIACDLHPKFITSKLAIELAAERGWELLKVQHHYAHLAKLIGEHGISEAIGIVCEGFGYGLNAKAWGGEILYCSENEFKRLGHLEEQPMVGGDLATKYPLRMLTGILHRCENFNGWIMDKVNYFPHGIEEIEIIKKQLNSKKFISTTSCGRFLDAISALLGICYERTYEGEPAMKLESLAIQGKDVLRLKPKIEGNVIQTAWLLHEIFQNLNKHQPWDLANSAQSCIANSLAELALLEAERLGVNTIGFTGGVAYNEHIVQELKNRIERSGLSFYLQKELPPGDGGISFGQTIFAGKN
ncbi:MAG: carbamoyltransferase HypF [Candidatus Bathyarchaeota archaeon]|nr:carbamoyltransferase HypF [Candidatus Bathyarchaeota archaeon]